VRVEFVSDVQTGRTPVVTCYTSIYAKDMSVTYKNPISFLGKLFLWPDACVRLQATMTADSAQVASMTPSITDFQENTLPR
jgi:hypothetical protein